ncbi:MAG: M1 family metallopeptidase [Aestuariibacter sp.]
MIIRKFFATFSVALLVSACQPNTVDPTAGQESPASEQAKVDIEVGKDYHSLSNYEDVRVTHIALDLNVDFDNKILSGTATLDVEREDSEVHTLILDTRDLTIEKVTHQGQMVPFNLAETDPYLGTPLEITLADGQQQVTVHYQTSPDASGVQWLTPEQTAGKQHPFLFTQAQAIHARSFIPLQDSPAVRITYEAVIRTPEALLAVMSAENDPDTERDGVYEFSMPQPIPSYLIALAVGDLQFKPMGERTGVYAEASWLNRAAAEFEDTEAMLIETEKRYGEYSWGRYDLLILPPSFPFGGMENPRLSFITPTVIAGDKSLVALIAHELAHSWSGNTITNATWRDLWLNEGFTTYLTYRIMEFIYGTERYQMELVLGAQDLQQDLNSLPKQDQVLAIDLRGRDADDVFSNIPYEKGALFLRELEQKIGRENFDQFLLGYFEHFAFQSITTEQFIDYLDETLLSQYSEQLDRQRMMTWIFQPGVPDGAPGAESDAFDIVDRARNEWLQGARPAADIETANWNFHQWKYFVDNLPQQLSHDKLAELDAAFGFTQHQNNEIAHSWLLLSIKNEYMPAYDRLYDYLTSIGRNKLVKPLYKALSATPEGKVLAQKAFAEAKSGYHPLTIKANEEFIQ